MILSEDESTAILLNGDDHVRIQTLQTGLTLDRLYEKADRIDDYIGERFDYAFDEKYGYLTSFPTNVGTDSGQQWSFICRCCRKTKISAAW